MKGSDKPLTVNPVPLTVICEIVTLAVPMLWRSTGRVLLIPSITLPKAVVLGLMDSRSVAPVPDNDTLAGELVALLTTEMLPVALPATVGANVTVKDVVWPAARVRGIERPVSL